MSRGKATFRMADMERAIKTAEKAGYILDEVTIEHETVSISFCRPGEKHKRGKATEDISRWERLEL